MCDSESFQTLVIKESLTSSDYLDNSEIRLLKGINGITKDLPSVQILADSGFAKGTILA